MYPVRSGSEMPLPDRLRYGLYPVELLEQKIHDVQHIVRRALDVVGPWTLSCSFGKDSLVLLDIVLDILPDIPVLYSDRGPEAELPETEIVIEKYAQRRPFNLVRVKPRYTMFELYRMWGLALSGSKIRYNNLIEPFDGWMKANGYVGSFIGRRMEENPKTRGKLFSRYGPLRFDKKRCLWSCDPLYQWTGKDVWAYIVHKDLPYHPVYDLGMNDPGGRERARISNWSGVIGVEYGRLARVKRDYPELFNRLAEVFPEARCYV